MDQSNQVALAADASDSSHVVDKIDTILNKNGVVKASDDELTDIRTQVQETSARIEKVEKFLQSKDQSVINSMEELFNSVKIISHNQSTLENKLDDLLNNQMNTDTIINKFKDFLDKLNVQMKHSNNNLSGNSSLLHALIGNSPSPLASYSNDSLRRGPGRPRKEESPLINDLLSTIPSSFKKVLPSDNIQISKSRRYFNDPLKEDDYDSSATTKSGKSSKQSKSKKTSSLQSENGSIKRRGRPPKKRTVDSVLVKVDYASDKKKPFEKSTMNSIDKDSEDLDTNGATEDEYEEIEDSNTIVKDDLDDNSLENSIIHTTRSNSKLKLLKDARSMKHDDDPLAMNNLTTNQEKELDKRRDDREKMLVNLKYNDRDRAKSFMESHKKLLNAMKEEERRKKLNPLNYSAAQKSPDYPSDGAVPSPSIDTITNSKDGVEMDDVSGTKEVFSSLAKADDSTANQPIDESKMSVNADISANVSDISKNEEVDESDLKNGTTDIHNTKRTVPNEFEDDFEDSSNLDSPKSRHLRKRKLSGNGDESISLGQTSTAESANIMNKSHLMTSSADHILNDKSFTILTDHPIELFCKGGLFYLRNSLDRPITIGEYLKYKYRDKENELIKVNMAGGEALDMSKQERMNAHTFKKDIDAETKEAFDILGSTILTEKYVNSLEYFLLEFRWENSLVGLGLKLKESKRTWQRRKALFALFEFWRDQSRQKRNFQGYTILHSVKEMESYRIFINRSVSWFYNHITLLKMILYDLCDNVKSHWREWMFPRNQPLPVIGTNNIDSNNINTAIDSILTLDFLQHDTTDEALALTSSKRSHKSSMKIEEPLTEIPLSNMEVSADDDLKTEPSRAEQSITQSSENNDKPQDEQAAALVTEAYVTNIDVANDDDDERDTLNISHLNSSP
ncbi:hypothetical protein TPHA_0D01960 [Tetrapisispora phaffii CBS 4417]|uniref:Suppressor of mar1-1 protein n=1 Tax=Tetrapisispora phaffii (strain ATCC 24235 / CBS 4417 / NBRC 1672 / NRRL Y-8282 / UCD 70-5) TaxID=1071381 RepID=G8BSL3_TETPH|nr:hypothetical protein TPHA_0D01960 [Tetrapisispora phaffii CBS 4417]CCE62834.1 hypothetical protein TPHA_0D01960 [Tetrapisispora phaffii CBS 4417]